MPALGESSESRRFAHHDVEVDAQERSGRRLLTVDSGQLLDAASIMSLSAHHIA